jgi:hypothetical protein
MNNKKLSFSILASVMLSVFMANIVSAVNSSRDAWANIGKSGTVLGYIFGPVPTGGTFATMDIISVMIIVVAVWILVAITFGDIIASFSSFSKWVSWTIGALIGIIAANMGWGVSIIAMFTSGFAIFGITSVYIGLGAAFVAFLIVNLGVTKLGGWVMGRKAMTMAQQSRVATAAGAAKVGAAVKGLKQIGKDLEAP